MEVCDSALGFDLKMVDFDGLAIASVGSAVERRISAVEKESAAVWAGKLADGFWRQGGGI